MTAAQPRKVRGGSHRSREVRAVRSGRRRLSPSKPAAHRTRQCVPDRPTLIVRCPAPAKASRSTRGNREIQGRGYSRRQQRREQTLQWQILNFAAAQRCTLALNTLQTIKNRDVRRVESYRSWGLRRKTKRRVQHHLSALRREEPCHSEPPSRRRLQPQ